MICNSNFMWRKFKWLYLQQEIVVSLPGNNSEHPDREWLLEYVVGDVSLQQRYSSPCWGHCEFMPIETQLPQNKVLAEDRFILSWSIFSFILASKSFNRGGFFNIGLICKFLRGLSSVIAYMMLLWVWFWKWTELLQMKCNVLPGQRSERDL